MPDLVKVIAEPDPQAGGWWITRRWVTADERVAWTYDLLIKELLLEPGALDGSLLAEVHRLRLAEEKR